MTGVADHTILAAFAETPLYGQSLLRQFTLNRRILAVPAPALMAAAATAKENAPLAELFEPLHRAVVRFIDLDGETALRVGSQVPMPRAGRDEDELRWLLAAPVVWAAQHLQMPVLTRQPDLYDGYPVQITRLP